MNYKCWTLTKSGDHQSHDFTLSNDFPVSFTLELRWPRCESKDQVESIEQIIRTFCQFEWNPILEGQDEEARLILKHFTAVEWRDGGGFPSTEVGGWRERRPEIVLSRLDCQFFCNFHKKSVYVLCLFGRCFQEAHLVSAGKFFTDM